MLRHKSFTNIAAIQFYFDLRIVEYGLVVRRSLPVCENVPCFQFCIGDCLHIHRKSSLTISVIFCGITTKRLNFDVSTINGINCTGETSNGIKFTAYHNNFLVVCGICDDWNLHLHLKNKFLLINWAVITVFFIIESRVITIVMQALN